MVEVSMKYDDANLSADPEIQSGTNAYFQTSESQADSTAYYPLRVKTGAHKRLPGFQPECICVSPWIDRKNPPYRVTSMSHNMHANL